MGVVVKMPVGLDVEGAGTIRASAVKMAHDAEMTPEKCDTSQGHKKFYFVGKIDVRFQAIPEPGWRFYYWEWRGDRVSNDPEYTMEVYKGTMIAHFLRE